MSALANLTEPRYEDFDVAIICTTQEESNAVEALLDGVWKHIRAKAEGDQNSYRAGRIGHHNVVLAYMPDQGPIVAAGVAASFRSTFTRIRLGLVVGICGGVPRINEDQEVLLGDVVISTGVKLTGSGRQYSDELIRKDTLSDSPGRHNNEIRTHLKQIQGWQGLKDLKANISKYLSQVLTTDGFKSYQYPGIGQDRLYPAQYRHKHQSAATCICATCNTQDDPVCREATNSTCGELGCDPKQLVSRTRLAEMHSLDARVLFPPPEVHFGDVASGNIVMKSASHRDDCVKKDKVIAFEMEGAGVWDNLPTVIIKAVCDYADSHKNDVWQKYAAAVAAATMKAFLEDWWALKKHGESSAKSTRTENEVPGQY